MIFKQTSYFYKVTNNKRYKAANEYYYHSRDSEGVDYLFSDKQLTEAKERASKNPEDIPNQPYYGLDHCFEESSKQYDKTKVIHEKKINELKSAIIRATNRSLYFGVLAGVVTTLTVTLLTYLYVMNKS